MELNELVSKVKQNNNWKNESRIIGEACEEYIQNKIKCIRCNNNNFEKYKTNEKSKDLICISCNQKYLIKAKSFTHKQVNNIKCKRQLEETILQH